MALSTPIETIPSPDEALQQCSSAAARIGASTIDSEVRVLSTKEYRAAALCLAQAFIDDHVIRYPIDTPDRAHWSEEEKWKLHLEALEYVTYAHCLKGLVTTVGPDYDCVALWMPPGKNMDDFFTMLRSGMWRLWFRFSAEGKKRFFDEFLPLLHYSKQAVLKDRDDDSYYLVYIGTKPSSRGQGYCRKLIEHVTRRADIEGRACYLESSNDLNPKIYSKLGFDTVKYIYLQREEEEIRMDLMVREPALKMTETRGKL